MLMLIALLSLFFLLLTFHVIMPVLQYQKVKEQREFDEMFRVIQLKYVRRHYEALHGMPFADIEEHYDVERAYYDI